MRLGIKARGHVSVQACTRSSGIDNIVSIDAGRVGAAGHGLASSSMPWMTVDIAGRTSLCKIRSILMTGEGVGAFDELWVQLHVEETCKIWF